MNNIVNETSIRSAMKDRAFSWSVALFIILVISMMIMIFCVSTADREFYAGWIMIPIFIAMVLVQAVGGYTNVFREKVCLNWYWWDMGRIKFFEEKLQELKQKYDADLSQAVEVAVRNNPQGAEELRRLIIDALNDLKGEFEVHRATILSQMSDPELEIVHLLQAKGRLDAAEERLEDAMVDALADIYREEQNPDLLRKRLQAELHKQNSGWLQEKSAWYNSLIDSCRTSTAALREILERDYNLILP